MNIEVFSSFFKVIKYLIKLKLFYHIKIALDRAKANFFNNKEMISRVYPIVLSLINMLPKPTKRMNLTRVMLIL